MGNEAGEKKREIFRIAFDEASKAAKVSATVKAAVVLKLSEMTAVKIKKKSLRSCLTRLQTVLK